MKTNANLLFTAVVVLTVTLGIGANSAALADPGIQVEIGKYSVNENAGAVTVAVTRGWEEDFAATVDYKTSDLTATAGQDYVDSNGTLQFAANEKRKLVSILVVNDALKEPNKTFRFALSNPTGAAVLGKLKAAVITIKDNDPGISFSRTTYSASEDAGEVTVTVLRGNDVDLPPFTVDYASSDGTGVADADYRSTSGTLSFAAGDQSKSFTVPILNDGLREGTKTVRLTLSNPSAGLRLASSSTATIRIEDNDPGVGFEQKTYSVWRNAGEVTVAVLRGNDWALGPITVDYATVDGTAKAGQQYQTILGTLEFRQNETVKSLTVPILRAAAAEGTKSFRLTLQQSDRRSDARDGYRQRGHSRPARVGGNYPNFGPPFHSGLTITASGPGLKVLTWSGAGGLQRADELARPWQMLTNAVSPTTIQPTTPVGFYRIKHPRPVAIYIPSTYDARKPLPLVILLHGYRGHGAEWEDYMRLAPLAEAKGFLYCFPDGTTNVLGLPFWNATDGCCDYFGQNVDDSGYLRALIEEIGKDFALDRKRVCLLGHSNGGFMAYRMACEHSDLIAAIASLAGMTFLDVGGCTPSQPVNVLHIHATGDAIYNGGFESTDQGSPADLPPYPGALETVRRWALYNDCADPVTDPVPSLDLDLAVPGLDTIIMRYTSFRPGGAVEFWSIQGGSHFPTLFTSSASSQFSEKVIDWLLVHPKP